MRKMKNPGMIKAITYEYASDGKRLKKVGDVGTSQQTTTFYFGDHQISNFGQGSNETDITQPHPNVGLGNGVASYLHHLLAQRVGCDRRVGRA